MVSSTNTGLPLKRQAVSNMCACASLDAPQLATSSYEPTNLIKTIMTCPMRSRPAPS